MLRARNDNFRHFNMLKKLLGKNKKLVLFSFENENQKQGKSYLTFKVNVIKFKIFKFLFD